MPPDAVPLQIRAATPGDLPAVAAFIARANSTPATQSLYCAAHGAASVRAALRSADDFPAGWERSFVVGVDRDGAIAAAIGCQVHAGGALGWIWGPWVEGAAGPRASAAAELLDGLLARLPATVERVETFLHAENVDGLRFLRERGFTPGLVTHIYVYPAARWTGVRGGFAAALAPLRPAHEVAFARLHAETFPAAASTPADVLLDGRDDEHAIFAATDGLRLLGYVCISVNRAPREGFIDYLAVRPARRGGGIGGSLLEAALRWTFEEQRLPQAGLCVTDWRGGARRLYERAGFSLTASGIGARQGLKRSPFSPRGRPPA